MFACTRLRAPFQPAAGDRCFRRTGAPTIIEGMDFTSLGRRSMSSGARVLCRLLPFGLWLAAAVCAAQEPTAGEDPRPAAPEATEKAPSDARPAGPSAPAPNSVENQLDLRYLEGPDGRPVFVPDKARLDEFLTWLAQRNARTRQGPPAVSVSSLDFEGTADDEGAVVMARIELQVAEENEWVRVPLVMPEGTLRAAAAHTGEGIAVPAPYHPDEGYTWWIRGKGRHQIVLSLALPVRKQAAQRRIQLSLPATAVSRLKLRVATPRVTVKAPERSTVSTKSANRETEIEVIGLGNRLDLAWQALPETTGAPAALEVTTAVVATLVDGESATLEATQLIQSLGQQEPFDEVRVSLPAGYELLRLEGPEHQDHKSDPSNPNQVVIQLKKPTNGPVELKWTVRSKLPAIGEPFALEGFEVDRARLQTGYLAVVIVGDFRLVRQPDEDKFLQRVDLADLPIALRQTPASAAYRFLNRLLLRMKLQRVEPYVTVDPALALHLSSDTAELEGTCRLQVLRGSIGAFRLRWPGWKQQGWAITEAELPGHIELRVAEEAGERDVIRLEFAEPAKGSIDLHFRAQRPMPAAGESVPLSLPVSAAYGRFQTPLAVILADNIEADLQPAEMTVFRPMAVPDSKITVPREWLPLRRDDYRVESPDAVLSLALVVHPRTIEGTTVVEAAVGRRAVTVRQTFIFDVAYERVAQLRFTVPEGVPPEQLTFFSQTGERLPVQVTASTRPAPAEVRVTLEAPTIGPFELEVRYALSRESGVPDVLQSELSVPLVQSLDAAFSSTRFSCRDAAGRDALVEGDGWLRQLAPEGEPVWMLGRAASEVPVKLGHAAGGLGRAVVVRALITTTVSVDGTIESRAQYEIADGLLEISLAFPPELEPVAFWWNDGELRPGRGTKSTDGTTHFDLRLPDGAGKRGRLLTIDFLAGARTVARVGTAFSLAAPRLSDEQATARVYWFVSLPPHQHLLTDPERFSPLYRWSPRRMYWSREPDLSAADLAKWIGAAGGPAPRPGPVGGNDYLFGAFGPPPILAFRSMSQSAMVLMGAGTALMLGLVLVKWPAMRHVLTVLSLAFLISLLGVWFAAPMQVLLQPALLGVALAMIAAAIDAFVKRRARPLTVTLTSSSSFMTPAPSHARMPVIGVGSNEFTSVRPPAEAGRSAGQLSESGNRA